MRRILAVAAALALSYAPSRAQESDKDLSALHEIKVEAFEDSKVMEHLASLTDLYGPRLTASPEWEQAAQWAMQEMKAFGLSNIHEEKWGPFGRSWSLESCNIDMLTPRYSHLVAYPLAWSTPTNGVQTGDVIFAPLQVGRWYEFKKNHEALEKYKGEWHGKLKGKVVLLSDARTPEPSTRPLFRRYTDSELADIVKAPEPVIRRRITVDQVQVPDNPEDAAKYMASLPNVIEDELFDKHDESIAELGEFLTSEGVVAALKSDQRAHNGLVFAEAAGSYKAGTPMAPASFVITEEQYSRMQRLLEKKQTVTVSLEVKAKFSDRDVDAANIIAEIPGQKKPDEVVMIGAHFDSWHTGTGATDNGAGSAVMIEVMRILKTLNLPLDRTVRIGLWSGEEQGLFGSRAYVKQHFADVKTGEVKPDQAKLDAYLNLDNGSGKIRGIYLEGNDAIRPLFDRWLTPFHDMGVTAISLRHTGGTDHLSFDDAGLPAFQFIQDPLDYGTVTHHSDMDTYPHAIQEDLMQASAVIATLVYNIANREDMVPRKVNVRNGKLPNP